MVDPATVRASASRHFAGGRVVAATRAAGKRARETTQATYRATHDDVDAAKRTLRDEFGREAFRRKGPIRYWEAAALLCGPWAAHFAWLALLYAFLGRRAWRTLATSSLIYYLPLPVGKETYIPAAVSAGADPVLVGATFTLVDVVLVVFVVYNFYLLHRLPHLGHKLRGVEDASVAFLGKRPWIRRFALLSLVVFVLIPFQGGGGTNAAILGKIMGLRNWKVVAAVAAGTAVESFTMAFVSKSIFGLIPRGVQYLVLGAVVGALCVYALAVHRQGRGSTVEDPVEAEEGAA